jgi:uncharacterized OsmC-like protein
VTYTEIMMTFNLNASRLNANGSLVKSKQTELEIDTSVGGRQDALNPVELLLAALAASMLKGVERLAPTIGFSFSEIAIDFVAQRPEQEARIETINYEIRIATDEPDSKLELLHKNLQKQGTIYNTVKLGTNLTGVIRRAERA